MDDCENLRTLYNTPASKENSHTDFHGYDRVGFVSDVTAYYGEGYRYTASLLTSVLGYDKLGLWVTSHILKSGVSM